MIPWNTLTHRHGSYGSWAIWNPHDEADTAIIAQNRHLCHARLVVLGLNISFPIMDRHWGNFRGGKHDRKLRKALNDSPFRGAYMTDLFKDIPEPDSGRLVEVLTPLMIQKNVSRFRQEMADVGVTPATTFVVMGARGSQTARLYREHFQPFFPRHAVVFHTHYSYYKMTDAAWVHSLQQSLGIVG